VVTTDPADTPIASLSVTCPFTILADTREQDVYEFIGLTQGSGSRKRPLVVPVMRATLTTGDYSIFGYPSICIERKSKADLFGSVVRRKNFIGRLARMNELAYSAVVVEAELSTILRNPPPFTRLHPRSLVRTIIAWKVRFPRVHWDFLPGREAAEGWVFRTLERFYNDKQQEMNHG
jgi:ERCC4-type nuclease